jgi:hypothetical protein
LVVQALQVFPVQMGVAPVPQVALVKHPTQVFVAASQTGVIPVQARALVAVQAPQLPPLRQARAVLPFRARHSASPTVGGLACAQPRQLNDVPSQMGVVAPEHCALVKHPTHAPVAVRHWSRPIDLAEHCAPVEHATHAPDAQMGLFPAQCELFRHALHAPAPSQNPPVQASPEFFGG